MTTQKISDEELEKMEREIGSQPYCVVLNMIDEIRQARIRIEELEDKNSSLQSDLDKKSGEIGMAEHRGNTVNYIYDKCENYGRQFSEMREKLKVAVEALVLIQNWNYDGYEMKKIASEALQKIRGEG